MKIYFYTLCYFIFSQICTSIRPRVILSQRTPKLCTHCKFYMKPLFSNMNLGHVHYLY